MTRNRNQLFLTQCFAECLMDLFCKRTTSKSTAGSDEYPVIQQHRCYSLYRFGRFIMSVFTIRYI